MAEIEVAGVNPSSASQRSLLQRTWVVVSGAFAALSGILPHILHHAGPLAGAALFAGFGGSLLFGILGLLVAIPFLIRLYRRFGKWQAPAIALVLFTVVFSISSFVVGPAITGEGSSKSTSQQPVPKAQPPSPSSHREDHH